MTTLADQERTARQFAGLCDQLAVEPDQRGECWLECVFCGKGGKHFSFSERGYCCFVCGAQGGLGALMKHLRVTPAPRPRVWRQEPPRPRVWQQAPHRWLDRYCEALDRVSAWTSYKPLSLDTIAHFQLGVGRLPSSRCNHRRLIVPVFSGGKVVAFHGRAFRPEDQDTKWLCAGGSDKCVLFLAGVLRPHCTIVIVENFVDAILAWQCEPITTCYVALGGLSWQPEWTARIAQARPAGALIWLDHDLAGNGSRYHHREMLEAWRVEMIARRAADPKLAARPFPPDPEPRAPKIANDLLAVGIRTHIYEWPRGSAWKADIGSELMK